MGITEDYKDVIESFRSVKSNLIDFCFRMMVILIGPLFAYSLYFLWPAITLSFVINSLILCFLIVFTFFNLNISLRVKKHILLFLVLYSYLNSTYNHGFFGGAQYFMILLFGITTFYFKRWLALSINIGVVVYYFVFMHLYTSGIFEYSSPPDELVKSKVIWIADFNLTLLTTIIAGYALIRTFKAYQQKGYEQLEKQKQFNFTIEKLPIPVAALTDDERIPYCNDMFYEYFGYKPEEIPTFGHWLEYAYPDPKIREKVAVYSRSNMAIGFKEKKQFPLLYYDFRTKSGELKSAEVHHTFMGNVVVCAFIDLTERRKKRRLIVETMMQAEEVEKQRIAQELHDGVGPLLSTAKIYAHSLRAASNNNDKLAFGTKLSELLDSSIKELRNTINNVSPQILKQYGLNRAIESFVNNLQPITTVKINVDVKTMPINSPMIELAIYRSLIELINNSIKYGSPSIINLGIDSQNKMLNVSYTDNGIGFDFEKERLKGFGLSNIVNRIETIGGLFKLETSPGQGVDVKMVFDLK